MVEMGSNELSYVVACDGEGGEGGEQKLYPFFFFRGWGEGGGVKNQP